MYAKDVSTIACSVARGNGKSCLAGAIASAYLPGAPLHMPRTEIVIVASSFQQARLVFEDLLSFVDDTDDRQKWRVNNTTQQALIESRETGARVRAVGADARRLHGLRPRLAILDESAQWQNPESMYSALRTSLGKMTDTKMLCIGTKPSDCEHFFSKLLAGQADAVIDYSATDSDPPFQKRTWLKANPSLSHLQSLEKTIRREAQDAKSDPALLQMFKALRLNMGTADTLRQHLISAHVWQSIENDAQRVGRCVWGVDLGGSAAQSAISAYWPESKRLEAMAAFPSALSLKNRGVLDGVGSLYESCATEGDLIQCGGHAVDYKLLVEQAVQRFGLPTDVAFDRWRMSDLQDAMSKAGIAARMHSRGMGFKDGSEDVRHFQRACVTGQVVPVRSLLMRSAMSEAVTVSDPAGNQKLAKGTENGRRLRARDDVAASSILAVSLGVRLGENVSSAPKLTFIHR